MTAVMRVFALCALATLGCTTASLRSRATSSLSAASASSSATTASASPPCERLEKPAFLAKPLDYRCGCTASGDPAPQHMCTAFRGPGEGPKGHNWDCEWSVAAAACVRAEASPAASQPVKCPGWCTRAQGFVCSGIPAAPATAAAATAAAEWTVVPNHARFQKARPDPARAAASAAASANAAAMSIGQRPDLPGDNDLPRFRSIPSTAARTSGAGAVGDAASVINAAFANAALSAASPSGNKRPPTTSAGEGGARGKRSVGDDSEGGEGEGGEEGGGGEGGGGDGGRDGREVGCAQCLGSNRMDSNHGIHYGAAGHTWCRARGCREHLVEPVVGHSAGGMEGQLAHRHHRPHDDACGTSILLWNPLACAEEETAHHAEEGSLPIVLAQLSTRLSARLTGHVARVGVGVGAGAGAGAGGRLGARARAGARAEDNDVCCYDTLDPFNSQSVYSQKRCYNREQADTYCANRPRECGVVGALAAQSAAEGAVAARFARAGAKAQTGVQTSAAAAAAANAAAKATAKATKRVKAAMAAEETAEAAETMAFENNAEDIDSVRPRQGGGGAAAGGAADTATPAAGVTHGSGDPEFSTQESVLSGDNSALNANQDHMGEEGAPKEVQKSRTVSPDMERAPELDQFVDGGAQNEWDPVSLHDDENKPDKSIISPPAKSTMPVEAPPSKYDNYKHPKDGRSMTDETPREAQLQQQRR